MQCRMLAAKIAVKDRIIVSLSHRPLAANVLLVPLKKRISDGISEFNERLNVLLLTFSHCHSSVKYHLFKTFCMPLYGSQLWDLTLKESQRLYISMV